MTPPMRRGLNLGTHIYTRLGVFSKYEFSEIGEFIHGHVILLCDSRTLSRVMCMVSSL